MIVTQHLNEVSLLLKNILLKKTGIFNQLKIKSNTLLLQLS